MRTFHCDHCGQLVFFENTTCGRCGRRLAYLEDRTTMAALVASADGTAWTDESGTTTYLRCANDVQHDVCNWAFPAAEARALCRACELTEVIPDLSLPANKAAWYRLEVAKRRLLATLDALGLPVASKKVDPEGGLAFHFLASGPTQPHVVTGHSNGLVTIDLAEADDAERERRRLALGEPYRTLLGHFRHEIGHYYWERLIAGTPRLDAFRALFGDERQSYAASVTRHYADGAPAGWQERYVSAYASVHPFEDWAETWAHYLHLADALETARACGVALEPRRPDEPALPRERARTFDEMIDDWAALAYLLNNLNRGLGLGDAYPFVLSQAALQKLRCVHDVIEATAARVRETAARPSAAQTR